MKERPLVLVKRDWSAPTNADLTPENHPGPYAPREADPHPPRCRHCRAIVETQFRGWPLPPGTGYCPKHNVVRFYQGRRDEQT